MFPPAEFTDGTGILVWRICGVDGVDGGDGVGVGGGNGGMTSSMVAFGSGNAVDAAGAANKPAEAFTAAELLDDGAEVSATDSLISSSADVSGDGPNDRFTFPPNSLTASAT